MHIQWLCSECFMKNVLQFIRYFANGQTKMNSAVKYTVLVIGLMLAISEDDLEITPYYYHTKV